MTTKYYIHKDKDVVLKIENGCSYLRWVDPNSRDFKLAHTNNIIGVWYDDSIDAYRTKNLIDIGIYKPITKEQAFMYLL